MSMSEAAIQTAIPHPLVLANTTARSILAEATDDRLIPEDLRERRFGYNPGFRISADPVHTGLQLSSVESGVAILFETGPVLRPRHSVDPQDRNPLTIASELLAGEGLNAILYQHEHMGFCELRPLRGNTDPQAGQAMEMVHPVLGALVEQKLIPDCPHKRTVCVTCRLAALSAIEERVPTAMRPLFDVLRENVTKARNHMRNEWNSWISEVAAAKGTPGGYGLRELGEGHKLFMQHLHEHAPSDAELVKIGLQTEGMAGALKEGLKEFAKEIAATMKAEPDADAQAELQMMRAKQAEMQEQLSILIEQARQNNAVQPVHEAGTEESE